MSRETALASAQARKLLLPGMPQGGLLHVRSVCPVQPGARCVCHG